MPTAFVISTNADLIKGSVSESLHHWCPRSSLQATASGQFRSSLAFIMTTRWPHDDADLRRSHYRGELRRRSSNVLLARGRAVARGRAGALRARAGVPFFW